MFYHIDGTLSEIASQLAVIDCSGVGYAINVPAGTLSRLKLGERAKLYTHCHIREDCFDIYGFCTLSEKRCFELLISVSGVGPKAALGILSATTPETFAMAVIGGDERALTAAPGVGKKIAQRIILELKDKLAKDRVYAGLPIVQEKFSHVASASGKLADAAAALTVLGYDASDAAAALRDIDHENESLESIIKLALKKMVK